MFCPVEVVIGFDSSMYNVNEDAQNVSVCASIQMGVQMESRNYTVAIRTVLQSGGKWVFIRAVCLQYLVVLRQHDFVTGKDG
jgi:hypothetical protein